MADPVDLGPRSFRKGNPYTLTLIFEGVDYTDKTFVSQIRATAASPDVLTEFEITTQLVDDDTHVVMYLSGDPALGENTGQTRSVGPPAVFDVERIDTATGVPEETMATGTLDAKQDVTR